MAKNERIILLRPLAMKRLRTQPHSFVGTLVSIVIFWNVLRWFCSKKHYCGNLESNQDMSIEPWGVYSIVKLNTTCDKKKKTKFHKGSPKLVKCFSFFSWVDIHNIYYIVKNCIQIWRFVFYIKHIVSN